MSQEPQPSAYLSSALSPSTKWPILSHSRVLLPSPPSTPMVSSPPRAMDGTSGPRSNGTCILAFTGASGRFGLLLRIGGGSGLLHFTDCGSVPVLLTGSGSGSLLLADGGSGAPPPPRRRWIRWRWQHFQSWRGRIRSRWWRIETRLEWNGSWQPGSSHGGDAALGRACSHNGGPDPGPIGLDIGLFLFFCFSYLIYGGRENNCLH